jgi:hypothetical protein
MPAAFMALAQIFVIGGRSFWYLGCGRHLGGNRQGILRYRWLSISGRQSTGLVEKLKKAVSSYRR